MSNLVLYRYRIPFLCSTCLPSSHALNSPFLLLPVLSFAHMRM